jgi:hypothetical protein
MKDAFSNLRTIVILIYSYAFLVLWTRIALISAIDLRPGVSRFTTSVSKIFETVAKNRGQNFYRKAELTTLKCVHVYMKDTDFETPHSPDNPVTFCTRRA